MSWFVRLIDRRDLFLNNGKRLTAGGRLGLHQLHPPCLVTNPAVSLVHQVSQVINDFWEATTKKLKEEIYFF